MKQNLIAAALGSTALVAQTLALVGAPLTASAQAPISASPGWVRAMPPGPDTRVKITEEYAKLVGKDAHFWAWPLVNMYNRRLHFASVKEMAYVGPLMEAPLNRLMMLTATSIPPSARSPARTRTWSTASARSASTSRPW